MIACEKGLILFKSYDIPLDIIHTVVSFNLKLLMD